jgi:hypothetical protein
MTKRDSMTAESNSAGLPRVRIPIFHLVLSTLHDRDPGTGASSKGQRRHCCVARFFSRSVCMFHVEFYAKFDIFWTLPHLIDCEVASQITTQSAPAVGLPLLLVIHSTVDTYHFHSHLLTVRSLIKKYRISQCRNEKFQSCRSLSKTRWIRHL